MVSAVIHVSFDRLRMSGTGIQLLQHIRDSRLRGNDKVGAFFKVSRYIKSAFNN